MSVTKGATTLNTKGHLTHWGWVTHICISELAIIGPDNGLSPSLRQAINWTNAGILSIGPLGINFNEILIEIDTFSFKKMRLKMSFAKWRPSCISLNVLNIQMSLIRIEISIVELDHLMTVLNIYMRNSYTGKTVSIHWSRQHVSSFIILGCILHHIIQQISNSTPWRCVKSDKKISHLLFGRLQWNDIDHTQALFCNYLDWMHWNLLVVIKLNQLN